MALSLLGDVNSSSLSFLICKIGIKKESNSVCLSSVAQIYNKNELVIKGNYHIYSLDFNTKGTL